MVKSGTNIEISRFAEVYSSLRHNGLGAGGFYNYGFRDYTPELARFTTIDPIKDDLNWFAYVGNEPINNIDRWGLSASDSVDTETWMAISLEATLSAAALAPTGLAVASGSSLVDFINLDTGEEFTSAYNFELTEATGVVLSAGASLELSAVIAELPKGSDQETVKNSYSGEFVVNTLTLGVVSGSTISSTTWNGAGGGAAAGLGAGLSSFTTTYGQPIW